MFDHQNDDVGLFFLSDRFLRANVIFSFRKKWKGACFVTTNSAEFCVRNGIKASHGFVIWVLVSLTSLHHLP